MRPWVRTLPLLLTSGLLRCLVGCCHGLFVPLSIRPSIHPSVLQQRRSQRTAPRPASPTHHSLSSSSSSSSSSPSLSSSLCCCQQVFHQPTWPHSLFNLQRWFLLCKCSLGLRLLRRGACVRACVRACSCVLHARLLLLLLGRAVNHVPCACVSE